MQTLTRLFANLAYLSLSRIESIGSDTILPVSQQGFSCSALPQNPRCFPISQPESAPSDPEIEPRDEIPYKSRPIRQAPIQQTLASGPRSITLRWPDEMQHAVFFTDQSCHEEIGRPEVTWHVERLGIGAAQCESPPAGLFKSVEFMKPGEYEAFSRKMREQDGTEARARWRGIL